MEDKKAVELMERTLKKVNVHFQVALPSKSYPPSLPNNREMANDDVKFEETTLEG